MLAIGTCLFSGSCEKPIQTCLLPLHEPLYGDYEGVPVLEISLQKNGNKPPLVDWIVPGGAS